MVFSSPLFLYVFLPLVLLGYFACPGRARNLFLVAASLLFYAWGEGSYVLLMLASVGFNYAMGRAIERAPGKKRALAAGVAGNVLALAYYKYWGVVWDGLQGAFGIAGGEEALPLPLGISFFTFQAISYLVDVYRRRAKAQRSLIDLALYITLFPQLVAGPIVRYESVAAAIRSRRSTWEGVTSGVELFIVGLAKKLLLANALGQAADACFAAGPGALPLGAAWLGVTAYALQIYFDFSGYTDMARGLGKVFGFEFPINFRLPYLSLSVREFWRRWHISLSTWFRDYVYIPLGGNRAGRMRTWVNLWAVFLLCGLWHGASWNFVVWGAAHGAWMTLEQTRPGAWLGRAPAAARWGVTCLFLLASWVLFRAESLGAALEYYRSLVAFGDVGAGYPASLVQVLDTRFWIAFAVSLALAFNFHGWAYGKVAWLTRGASPLWLVLRYGRFASLLALSLLGMAAEAYNPFIYFRF